MHLVTPKSDAGPLGRVAEWLTRRRVGRTIEPVQVALHHPRLLIGMGACDEAIEGAGALDPKLKALVSLKAASVANCSFCLDIGSAEARKKGVGVDELHALTDHAASELFSWREKLALDYAAALSRSPVEVPDELVAELRSAFAERELLELNYMIAWENFRARSNKGLGIEPAGFTHESRRARADEIALAA